MPRGEVTVSDIARALDARVESVVAALPGTWRREGNFIYSGDVSGAAGRSLVIPVKGSKAGWWRDWSSGESGDMLKLIALAKFGGSTGEAVKWAKSFLGWDGLDPERLRTVQAEARKRAKAEAVKAEAQKLRIREMAVRIWQRAVPLPGTPAAAYLKGRGIDLARLGRAPGALRFAAQCWNVEANRDLPALVMAVMSLAGRHVATHRIWIEPDGRGGWRKAALNEPKMCLGRFWEGHIPLWKGACGAMPLRDVPAGTAVHVSEGVEDGLSVAVAEPTLRIVAAVTLGNIGAIRLPEQAGPLVILGQNDPAGSKAEQAFLSAVAVQQARGREVRLTRPPVEYKDFNDQLRGIARAPDSVGVAA